MSDTGTDGQSASNEGGNTPSGETPAAGDEFKPITSQDDLNKVISERITRERAKFADYKDVKAKAARLDELEEAQKTETQRAKDALDAAQRDAESARAEALRFRIASKFQVSDEDAELFLTATDEETLTKQAQRLTDRTADRKKAGNHVSREGTNPTSVPNDEKQFVRDLFQPSGA